MSLSLLKTQETYKKKRNKDKKNAIFIFKKTFYANPSQGFKNYQVTMQFHFQTPPPPFFLYLFASVASVSLREKWKKKLNQTSITI